MGHKNTNDTKQGNHPINGTSIPCRVDIRGVHDCFGNRSRDIHRIADLPATLRGYWGWGRQDGRRFGHSRRADDFFIGRSVNVYVGRDFVANNSSENNQDGAIYGRSDLRRDLGVVAMRQSREGV